MRTGPGENKRLESWKEIAAHFGRSVKTVRRWEKTEGLPVHRHMHSRKGTPYAFTKELDDWMEGRCTGPGSAAVVLPTREAARASAPIRGSHNGLIRLVVLAFENLSGDPEQDHLGKGLTEEMITYLGQLCPERLRIVVRISATHYRNGSVGQIRHELGVDYILEGSMRRAGNQWRVTARLLSAEDESQLWSHSYDCSLSKVFSVQEQVAEQIARSLSLAVLPQPRASLHRGKPTIHTPPDEGA